MRFWENRLVYIFALVLVIFNASAKDNVLNEPALINEIENSKSNPILFRQAIAQLLTSELLAERGAQYLKMILDSRETLRAEIISVVTMQIEKVARESTFTSYPWIAEVAYDIPVPKGKETSNLWFELQEQSPKLYERIARARATMVLSAWFNRWQRTHTPEDFGSFQLSLHKVLKNGDLPDIELAFSYVERASDYIEARREIASVAAIHTDIAKLLEQKAKLFPRNRQIQSTAFRLIEHPSISCLKVM